MDDPTEQPSTQTPSELRGGFSWTGLSIAVCMAPLIGLVWAWIALVVQFYSAPFLVFPMLVGVFVGLTVVGLVRFTQMGHRATIVLMITIAAVVAAAGQHVFAYWNDYYWARPASSHGSGGDSDLSPFLAQVRPTFGKYLDAQAQRGRPLPDGIVAQGNMAWLTWIVDALLLVAAALVIALPAVRAPYCNRCHSWYRTVRGMKTDWSTSLQLASLIGVEPQGRPRPSHCRLSACQGGCGPTRCELSWEGHLGSIDWAQAWLDASQRNRVLAVLDGLQKE